MAVTVLFWIPQASLFVLWKPPEESLRLPTSTSDWPTYLSEAEQQLGPGQQAEPRGWFSGRFRLCQIPGEKSCSVFLSASNEKPGIPRVEAWGEASSSGLGPGEGSGGGERMGCTFCFTNFPEAAKHVHTCVNTRKTIWELTKLSAGSRQGLESLLFWDLPVQSLRLRWDKWGVISVPEERDPLSNH